jgi:hypothetical protein
MMNNKMTLGIALMVMTLLLVLTVGCSGKKGDGSVSGKITSSRNYDPESDFEAEPIDGGTGVSITRYVGSKWEINIPPQIQNRPVIRIERNAFDSKNLLSVTIPNSVTYIAFRAFHENKLTSVVIPNSVKYIEAQAFSENPITSITIGADVDFQEIYGGFDLGLFDDEYIDQGKRAGTYTRFDEDSYTWTRK